MRCLAGLVSASWCVLSVPALAQAPKPAPARGSATFPATETAPPPATAVAPTADAPGAPPDTAPIPPATAATPDGSALPPPPPAAPPPVAPPPAATAPPVVIPPSEPPPPPPIDMDSRPIRARRPFFIGGELGWNGLAGLGVNFSWHPEPHVAIDTGAGLSITGLRAGFRVRTNLLTGEWTPFVGVGLSYAGGSGGQEIDGEVQGDKVKYKVLPSPFLQLGGGVNYTGTEGFVFTAGSGYSLLLKKENVSYVSGSTDAFHDIEPIYDGGLILSVAFGYAF